MTDYYLVLQKSYARDNFRDIPMAFVSVSDNQLEHIEGDHMISGLMALENGKPVKSPRALLNYDIIPFVDKTQCDFHQAMYRGETCEVQDSKVVIERGNRIHSARFLY